MKTCGKASTKSAAGTSDARPTEPTTAKVQLSTESTNPPHLFVLPKYLSQNARIVTLENPRSFNDDRYVICPENGFFEFTKIAAPKTSPRSWLLSTNAEDEEVTKPSSDSGYVTKTANLLIATRIDPLFIILPALSPLPTIKSSEPTTKLFLSSFDYFEKVTKVSPHFASFSQVESIRALLESRMAAVCDTVEAEDELMYRLNEEKLLGELLKKAQNMTQKGLPASMEEKFVRKALDPPMLSMKRDESSLSEAAKEEVATLDSEATVSSADTAASSFSEASTAVSSVSEDLPTISAVEKPKELCLVNAPDGVAELLRIRTALFFICSAYVAPHITESLKKLLASSTSTFDFTPLDVYLAQLAKLRQDALASRSLGDFSRKRSMAAEDGESRAEKKRKEDEDEKRKRANQSRGVQQLKKVNVSGMKKMSDFFKKK
ncbi:hypothetical protein BUE80_DR003860 [Diplocarpon rosae]|nr:hypothetical protein BUE80_DR003860 [Diplocarpon rosae]